MLLLLPCIGNSMWKRLYTSLSTVLVWLVFSPHCLLCKTETYEDNSLCGLCWSKLSFITGNISKKCGRPLSFTDANALCDCTSRKSLYQAVRSAMIYDEAASKLLHNFKYYGNLRAKRIFCNWMLRAGEDIISKASLITAVPLHRNRLRQRQYNQSLVLAREIARATNIELVSEISYSE